MLWEEEECSACGKQLTTERVIKKAKKCLICQEKLEEQSLNHRDNSWNDEEGIEIGFWIPDSEGIDMPRGIMLMGQVFEDKDLRRRWNGYWIYFYPHEFIPPWNKSLDLLHIHFKGQRGEARVYLPSLAVEEKWGNIRLHEQNEIKIFVKKNYQDIINKVEEELRKREIK